MKKILFISTRNPFSGRYSGDVIRSLKIVNFLKKKYNLDILCLGKKGELKNKNMNILAFNESNFFFKIFYCIVSLLKFEPIQFGLFYSREMREYLREYAYQYDCLFFYHIRSSQYLPTNYRGKSIIEMGDLYSENYLQTFNNLNIFNPLKYIYLLESILVTKTEKKIFSIFDKVTLFSKNEVKKINLNIKGKIHQVDECIDIVKNKYKFSKNNFRILFIGNLNYLPNFLACKDFIKNDLPFLKKEIPHIKFSIIGNVNKFKKFLLSGKPEVEVLGFKKDISKYVKNSICGLANLKIATGVQVKVLTYMSYGLPVICSRKVSENFGGSVLSFKNNKELHKVIYELKSNKIKSNKFSQKSLKLSKSLSWKKISLKYLELINY